jgi:hypothetical protein
MNGGKMAVKKTSRYFDGRETRSREERGAGQAGELAAMMRLAMKKSPLMRKRIESTGLTDEAATPSKC